MSNLIPLRGSQLKNSPMPPSCPVYVYDEQTPAFMVSQGTVRGIFLQMGAMAECELLFKVEVPSFHHSSGNRNGNGKGMTSPKGDTKSVLLKPKRLRFRNGCPVSVKCNRDASAGVKSQVVEGIVLGTCDIPETNDRKGDTFWYSIQLLDGDGGKANAPPTIVHNVKAEQVSYRKLVHEEPSGASERQEIIEIEDDDDDENGIKQEDENKVSTVKPVQVDEVPSEIQFHNLQDGAAYGSANRPPQKDRVENKRDITAADKDYSYYGRKNVMCPQIGATSSTHASIETSASIKRGRQLIDNRKVRSHQGLKDSIPRRDRNRCSKNDIGPPSKLQPPVNEKKRRLDAGPPREYSKPQKRRSSAPPVSPARNHSRNHVEDWMFVPPTSGEETSKIFDGKKFYWCRKCSLGKGRWVSHPEESHVDHAYLCNTTYRKDLFSPFSNVKIYETTRSIKSRIKPQLRPHRKSNYKQIPICLNYHIIGRCSASCKYAQDHRPLEDSEERDLLAWCKDNYIRHDGGKCVPTENQVGETDQTKNEALLKREDDQSIEDRISL